MIDIRGNDGATRSDFSAHKLRRDFGGDPLGEPAEDTRACRDFSASWEEPACCLSSLVADNILRHFGNFCPPHVFPDGDKLHLRRDDAGARVGELRHHPAWLGAQWPPPLASEPGKFNEPVFLRLAGVGGMLA